MASTATSARRTMRPRRVSPANAPLRSCGSTSADRTVMAVLRRFLDRVVAGAMRAGMVLVLPLALLLFLQWPLRDLVQAYSREANDLAQCLFALYVSLAITFATRRRAHLATDVIAQRYPGRARAIL